MTDPIAANRRYWERESVKYQREHDDALTRAPMAWGVWRIAESRLKALGPVKARSVLELGCGGAQWSVALRDRGARVVGLDLSTAQLAHARGAAATLPLVQASADRLPFSDNCFDIVFCDHGAMSFVDPHLTLPEVARVLRDGGRLAFCSTSPLRYVCADRDWHITTTLQRSYFGLWEVVDDDDTEGGSIDYCPTHGQWIELLTTYGFVVDALHELRPSSRATTSYPWFVTRDWARRWPAEDLWVTHWRRSAT